MLELTGQNVYKMRLRSIKIFKKRYRHDQHSGHKGAYLFYTDDIIISFGFFSVKLNAKMQIAIAISVIIIAIGFLFCTSFILELLRF